MLEKSLINLYGFNHHFTADYLHKFAEDFEIKNPEAVLRDVCLAVSRFTSLAKDNALPESWIEKISGALDSVFPDRKKII